MMRIMLTITFIFLLAGCKSKTRISGGAIPEKKMRLIVADLMKADQFLASYALKDTVSDKEKERYKLYQQVLDVHHVSKERFWQSFSYYKMNPERLGELMDSIQKALSPSIIPADEINQKRINSSDSVTDLPDEPASDSLEKK